MERVSLARFLNPYLDFKHTLQISEDPVSLPTNILGENNACHACHPFTAVSGVQLLNMHQNVTDTERILAFKAYFERLCY